MRVPKRSQVITLAIPASFTIDAPHLREKTSKLGQLARSAAIFRVSQIVLYDDFIRTAPGEVDFAIKILSYMNTPQYLRKRLYKLSPDLKFVGILPPMRTPNHPLESQSRLLKPGDFREGVVIETNREFCRVDIGVEKPAQLRSYLKPNTRLTVRITTVYPDLEVVTIDNGSIGTYWGFEARKLGHGLSKELRKTEYDLTIATSRFGSAINAVSENLRSKWQGATKALLAFGPSSMGLQQIMSREGVDLEKEFTFVINAVKDQGTDTIRTEEAVTISLSALASVVGS
ncbi:MAG: putative RNA uridine N3 methyltransferase [Candidatus Bathyarchaeia archaeon]